MRKVFADDGVKVQLRKYVENKEKKFTRARTKSLFSRRKCDGSLSGDLMVKAGVPILSARWRKGRGEHGL